MCIKILRLVDQIKHAHSCLIFKRTDFGHIYLYHTYLLMKVTILAITSMSRSGTKQVSTAIKKNWRLQAQTVQIHNNKTFRTGPVYSKDHGDSN